MRLFSFAMASSLSVLTLATTPTFPQSGASPHQFTLRVQCVKRDSGGCTASAPACANAPGGRYFPPQSVSGEVSGSLSPGRDPICGTATTGGEGVSLNGLLAPTSMCANLHAESGSGMMGIGQTYYVNCTYTATTYDLPT
jgi:hypothetical protein